MNLQDLKRRLDDLRKPLPGETSPPSQIFTDRRAEIAGKCKAGCPTGESWGQQVMAAVRRRNGRR